MKKTNIFILILLLALPVHGAWFFSDDDGVTVAGGADNTIFYWDGTDCTTPATVTTGGVSGTLGSANTDGSTSFRSTGGLSNGACFDNESTSDNYFISFSVTARDILDERQGTIQMHVSVQTVGNFDRLFQVEVDSNNRLLCYITDEGSGQFGFWVETKFGGTTASLYDAGPYNTSTLTKIKFNWDTSTGAISLYVDDTLEDSNTNAGTWSGTPTTIYIGANNGSTCSDSYFDEVYISDVANDTF